MNSRQYSMLLLSPRCSRCVCTTSSANYPFPNHAHPTPHQIFHLSAGATQKEIKARYYELVRVHHPDSPLGRNISPSVRHSRFQSITAAYDILRGKRTGSGGSGDIYRAELERRRRARAAYEASRGQSYPRSPEWSASADDRWKDRIILFVGILALGAGLGPALVWPGYSASYQAHVSAAKNLAQARQEAREYGEERRKEIRRRVQEFNDLKGPREPSSEEAEET
ncbi:hypothetical protein BC628DRAFT_1469754 [Trametes gibbosa]|nr:hypothetical protein BC628DRAFT_1469754 [Trametes gibbosa]